MIKDRLREAREKAGLTQKELAAKIGLPYQTVQNWEYGKYKPGYNNLLKLCKALDITLDELNKTEPGY